MDSTGILLFDKRLGKISLADLLLPVEVRRNIHMHVYKERRK